MNGGIAREEEGEQHQVVPGRDRRAAFAGLEVDRPALEGEQLACALEGGLDAVPDPQIGAREVPAPYVLGVERREGVAAGGPGRRRRAPPRPAAGRARATSAAAACMRAARRRARPSGSTSGGRSIARAVQVEHQRGQQQHEAGAARRGGERAEHADGGPAPLAGAPEEPDRERQVERLRVDRREEEGHRRERGGEHRQAGRLGGARDRPGRPSSSVVRRWIP